MSETIVIIHHSCGHVQEHVNPYEIILGVVGTVWDSYDWIDRLEKVPCVPCCRIKIIKAERELECVKKRINYDILFM